MGLLKDLYTGDNRIDFPKWWPRLLVLSAVLVVISVGALVVRGLNLGIDFEGGTVYEVTSDASVADARTVLEDAGYEEARIQTVEGGRLRIQTGIEDPQEAARLGTLLSEELGPVESLEQVGPTWGDEVTEKARNALVWFFVILTIYIAVRLEWRMAIGALVAVVHDIVLSVGVYAVFQIEVSPGTVVAFLTIMGYSLYDTVVVYDKAKSIEGRLGATGKYTYTEMMGLAMNRVFMRSINASLTSLLPVLSILIVGSYILGASTLREFGWALFVGLIVGAYSSLTIAAVTVIALKEREPRYREIRERLAARGVTSARMIEREDALLGAGAAAARSARGGVRREPTAAGAPPADPSAEERPPATPAPTGAIPPRPRKKKR
ncbi:MAG: protein translocase subunit SecF [Acidimicrobiales bacterium]|jgi:preprotein translocase subunit SecF|nr:protein translocase subunit SecF [Acidimicrobiales bacterium]